ncbi:MAG: Citrate transporter, partial [Rhizobacter sp.]|nr:Citrate transporter [Rhizobacter sp.]
NDRLFLVLLLALALFTAFDPAGITRYPSLVDWPTLAALAGLLELTKGVEDSGALIRAGRWQVGLLHTERALAIGLVLAAAVLAMVLTNDVALFVIVPLTLGVCRVAGLRPARLVIFEALAVNAGSALTPIGNPQNLFLWQRSQTSFGAFVLHMLPLVVGMMALLLVLTAVAFKGRHVELDGHAKPPPLDTTLLATALVLYIPFLVATDLHHAGWAFAAVMLLFAVLRRKVLAGVDWGLLLVFLLMFIDLRLLAGNAMAKAWISQLNLADPANLYFAGIGASQIVSNVPAAIALAEYSKDWQVMAYAVSVGGFGLLIGSLANLIAMRMLDDRKAWWQFHLWAVPFLAAATAMGYALLFMR